MCRILYRLLVSLARLAVHSGRSKDLEIIVLRHQLAVLRRQNHRPALAEEDRALLGAIAEALSRRRRAGWLVTPETLLRWHRRRIARHWTQPCRTPGRPCTPVELRRLIIDMATNNPTWGYRLVSGGREPPPPALLEPYVTVSRHTAPTVRRWVEATRCQ